MDAQLIDEPELEFARGERHIDLRFGLMEHGPSDHGRERRPTEIKLGIVGTERSIEDAALWLSQARGGLAASGSKKKNLFSPFPGFSTDSAFACDLILDRSSFSSVGPREIHEAAQHGDYEERIRNLTKLFGDAVQNAASKSPHVILVAMPTELLEEIAKAEECLGTKRQGLKLFFHDLLKANWLGVIPPLQLARPQTFGVSVGGVQKDVSARSGTQDEATRAWNFFAALYYKAGGFPWRLPRSETEYQTCFIGIAFLQNVEQTQMHTSIAEVFNERGHGIAIVGREARTSAGDLQPHLAPADVEDLVARCLKAYQAEHKTKPARVVVQKTSNFDKEELGAFRSAIEAEDISIYDLMTLDRSLIRLYREGYYPPLRGTWVELEPQSHLLYTRGSVAFYEEYPGMYVPQSLLVKLYYSEAQRVETMRDLMLLTKLNWNNIQMDSTLPITVSGARLVGSILRWSEQPPPLQVDYRYFM